MTSQLEEAPPGDPAETDDGEAAESAEGVDDLGNPGTSERRPPMLRQWAFLAAFLIPSGVMDMWFTFRSTTNVVYADTWAFVPMLGRTLSGHFSMNLLWAAHNENRQPFLRAAFLLSAEFDHFNTMHLRAFGIMVLLVEEALLLMVALRLRSPALRLVVGLAIALLASSVGQWESMLLEENWMFFLTVAGATASFLLLERRLHTRDIAGRRWLTYVTIFAAATVSSLSLAAGLVVWVVLVLRTVTFRLDRAHLKAAALVAGVGIVESFLYAWNMPGGGLGTRTILHKPVSEIFHFFILCEGSSIFNVGQSSARYDVGDVLGGILLAAFFAIIVVAWRSETARRDPVYGAGFALAVFGMAEVAFIDYGRIGLGITLAFGSRYTTLTQTLPIGIVVCLARLVDLRRAPSLRRPRWRYAAALVAVEATVVLLGVGVGLTDNYQVNNAASFRIYFNNLERTLLNPHDRTDSDLAGFVWTPNTVRHGIAILRRYHLTVYSGAATTGPAPGAPAH